MHVSESSSLNRVVDRLRSESGSALLLVVVAVIALIWANSPWSESYVHLWETDASIAIGSFSIDMNLHHWVNDGLMVVFFFLIGLEVRQELAIGSLRDRRRAMVPLIAGLFGVLLPALITWRSPGRPRRTAGVRWSAPIPPSCSACWPWSVRRCPTSCGSSC